MQGSAANPSNHCGKQMIGIFDSGIGGLRVLRQIRRQLPRCDLLYFGDTAHMPFGDKSAEAISAHVQKGISFLTAAGARVIIIASHTAAALAANLQIPNGTHLFDPVTISVQLALDAGPRKAIGIMATTATVASGQYPDRIRRSHPDTKVYQAPCPVLIQLVAQGWLKRPETHLIAKKYLHPLKTRQIDTLILASNHFLPVKA
ncbi:MAG: aspartate/glutamate racemase family protein, partial [Deltaproteobacteria bacterium]|nr:aspartate/glutamate racemase family protein [Deltaproteobacteria bacterium]